MEKNLNLVWPYSVNIENRPGDHQAAFDWVRALDIRGVRIIPVRVFENFPHSYDFLIRGTDFYHLFDFSRKWTCFHTRFYFKDEADATMFTLLL